MGNKKGIEVAATILVLMSLPSCGIFETRDPEQPGQSGSNFVPPTEPLLVFTNMENSFRDLSAVNYLRSFSDLAGADRNFVFEPTPEARESYGGIFAEWTRESERKYFEYMNSNLQSGQIPTLNFGEPEAQSIQQDSAQYEAAYILTIPRQNGPLNAQGTAVFHMLKDKSHNWVIWRWVDLAQPQDSVTWSDVKGQFGQ